MLTGKVDCDSEVTGIEFNQQLKQVATSHHTYIQDAAAHVVNRVIEKIIYLILKKTYISYCISFLGQIYLTFYLRFLGRKVLFSSGNLQALINSHHYWN